MTTKNIFNLFILGRVFRLQTSLYPVTQTFAGGTGCTYPNLRLLPGRSAGSHFWGTYPYRALWRPQSRPLSSEMPRWSPRTVFRDLLVTVTEYL